MKKKKTQLILVTVLLAGALAAYFLLAGSDGPAADPVADDSIYVLGAFPQPYVLQVEVRNDRDTFVIENLSDPADPQGDEAAEESLFTIQGLASIDLNQSQLRSIMNTAGGLEAKKVIDGEPATFGLDHPIATVIVTYEDGSATMTVGDDAPGDEGVYVAVDGTIYLVASNRLTGVTESRYAFVNKTITPGNSTTTTMQSLTLSGEGLDGEYTIEKIPEADLATWPLPSTHRMNGDMGVDAAAISALRTLYGLTALEVVDAAGFQDETAAAYGLDQPYFTAQVETVFSGDEASRVDPFTLILSEPDGAGLAYAQISTGGFLYRVNTVSLPFLGYSLFDYMEKTILAPDISRLSQVEVAAEGRTHVFQLETAEDGAYTVTMDGGLVDPDLFQTFYDTLTAARYEGAVDQASEQDGEQSIADGDLLLQYTYRYRDGTPDSVVTFRSGAARRPLAALDGGTAYYAQSLYVDQVLAQLDSLASTADDEIIGSADGPTAWVEDGQVVSQSPDSIKQ